MKFEKLKQEKKDILDGKNLITSDFENITKSKDLNMPGVYILVEEETQEVVYIGSTYARSLKDRLSQYLWNGSGNTLKKDLIYFGKTTNKEFLEYLKKLQIIAFEEHSSEYILLQTTGLITVNKAGTKKQTRQNRTK